MPAQYCFVGYPAAVLRETPGGKAALQRIWGSYLRLTGSHQDKWHEVKFGRDLLWVHEDDTQPDATLEILFLDIGQGDGCLLTTPGNRKLIIDAGAGDNMIRFLNYKYRYARRKPIQFDAFVITHPDQDHYDGFDPVFADTDFAVKTVYHSGLVERTAASKNDTLGKRQKIGRRNYVTELVATKTDLDKLLTNARIGRKQYPRMLRKALDSPRVRDIRMINAADGYLPGYGPGAAVSLQVLGPVPENVNNGQPALRWLSNLGKTKNGHSIVLRLTYGKVSFMLGGDLNIPAEEYMLAHYTHEKVPPRSVEAEELLIKKARRVFASDFAKSCHHGSADFSELFLKAVHAHATVISSGDDEPHAHPRADTLGTIGKHSRGRRSLIFSTELSRSAKETIKNPDRFRQVIRDAGTALEAARRGGDRHKINAAVKKSEKVLARIERSVSVFGAINMRTDGDRAIFAYKIERPRSKSHQWDIYKFERNSAGDLFFVSKH